jgi:hypothetical protein
MGLFGGFVDFWLSKFLWKKLIVYENFLKSCINKMSILDKFLELRSHLERCRILLDDLYANREDIDSMDGTVHVMGAKEDVTSAINKTIRGIVAHKNAKGITRTFPTPTPAKRIKEHKEYKGDAEIVDAATIEYERDCGIVQSEKPKSVVRYHPDPRLNKIMQTAIEMGGMPIEKYIPKFKMEKPPMELWDIYTFIQELKIKRENCGKKYETGVYAHLCEYGTIYVGIARLNHMGNGAKTVEESVRMRLNDHRNWHECSMKAYITGLFRVLSMLFYFPGDKKDEDLLVYLLNECLPKFRVRGGQYAGVGVTSIPSMDVVEIKNKLLENS